MKDSNWLGHFIYFLVVAGAVIWIGMSLSPILNAWIGDIDTTGFAGYVVWAIKALPFAFIGIIAYIVYKAKFHGMDG